MNGDEPTQRRSILKPALYVVTFAAVVGAGLLLPEAQFTQVTEKAKEVARPYLEKAGLAVPIDPPEVEKYNFKICNDEKRTTCIVDGDTIWLKGEQIRLEGIDAPERENPGCYKEAKLAKESALALKSILNGSDYRITRNGVDRYARTLGTIRVGKVTAGEMLIRLNLAQPWQGSRANWC